MTYAPQRQATLDLDRIGDILKRVRVQRGEELEAISEYLRIRPSYLMALEENHYEELPADAYVIGFFAYLCQLPRARWPRGYRSISQGDGRSPAASRT